MEPLIVNCPIPKANLEQFAGVVSYAGEIACNLFVAGGGALTLRMGSYHQRQNPNTGVLEEVFVPNVINKATGDIMLEAVCDRDPANGARDVNPFSVNLWPLSMNGKPTTIAEALGTRMAMLPTFAPSASHLSMGLFSDQAMFLLRKVVSAIFALSVTRSGPDVGMMLMRGGEVTEQLPVTKFRKVKKPVQVKKRDASGKLIFTEAVDADNKPVFDPVCDRAGRPMFDPSTGEIRKQRRLNYEMETVQQDVEEPYSEIAVIQKTGLYLLVARNNVIETDDFLSVAANESAFDPTWMLADVLAGKCKDKKTYHGMGEDA